GPKGSAPLTALKFTSVRKRCAGAAIAAATQSAATTQTLFHAYLRLLVRMIFGILMSPPHPRRWPAGSGLREQRTSWALSSGRGAGIARPAPAGGRFGEAREFSVR